MTFPIGYTKALTDHLIDYTEKAALAKQLIAMMGEKNEETEQAQNMSEEELAGILDDYLENPEEDEMLEAYTELLPPATYESNMEKFGYVDLNCPSAINIYADNFENKEAISKSIDTYNSSVSEQDQIQYIDYVGTLMSSVTTIINVVSYILMAFVAVSLIVSSIMIGLFSDIIGIGITLLILIPGNMIIHSLVGITTINASLPIAGSLILVVLSVILTLIGGFIPARHAAGKDPVSALRTE